MSEGDKCPPEVANVRARVLNRFAPDRCPAQRRRQSRVHCGALEAQTDCYRQMNLLKRNAAPEMFSSQTQVVHNIALTLPSDRKKGQRYGTFASSSEAKFSRG